jgi:thioredoxin-related protein
MFIVALLATWVFTAQAETPTARDQLADGMVNPGYEEKPAWFKNSFLDIREDIDDATANGRRVLLYFYQDGCPYCAKLLRENYAQQDIETRTRAGFDVIAINLWGDRDVVDFSGKDTTEKSFAVALKVMFTPTLLFLNDQGGVVLRVNGYYAPHKFAAALDYVAGKHEATQSFREYYVKANPVPARGVLHIADDYLPAPYQLSQASRKSGKPLLVLFEQKQCVACDELHLDIFQREQSKPLLQAFDVVLLDMWSREPLQTTDGATMTAAQWATQLDIKYAPGLVLFDPEGNEAFRTEGYLKAFHVQSSLDYVRTGAYKTQPNFQRYISARAEALEAQGIHVDIME